MFVIWASNAGGYLARNIRAKAMEWVLTGAAVFFGAALVLPESTFSLSQSYAVMEEWTLRLGFTENGVGWSIVIAGAIRLAILLYNGMWQSSPKARRWLAYAFQLFWFVVFISFYSAVGFKSTGAGVYLMLAFGEFLNASRASQEQGRMLILLKGGVVSDEPHPWY